jgi:glutamate/tyrosine decarboxylase-like PLP-dependent enzyme
VKPIVRQDAPYLEDEARDPEFERHTRGIGVYILEGSKPGAAAAGVWLSHTLIPLDSTGHGKLVQQTVRNACELHSLLENYPCWNSGTPAQAVTLVPPGSNIVCYAFRPIGRRAALGDLNRLNETIYSQFTVPEDSAKRVYDQKFFVSRTMLSARQYRRETVLPFLERLGVSGEEYEEHGVFLLRSVLMNPWYAQAKEKGRHFLAELVEELYAVAGRSLPAI